MGLFGGNKDNKVNLPVPQVKALGERGYSEGDIKEILKKKGYTDSEINTTLQKALSDKVGQNKPSDPSQKTLEPSNPSPPPREERRERKSQDDVPSHLKPSFEGGMGGMPRMSAEEHDYQSAPDEPISQSTPSQDTGTDTSEHVEVDIEPIVEAIVEEKWDDMAMAVNNIDERLSSLEENIKNMKSNDQKDSEAEYLRNQLEEKMENLENQVDMMDAKLSSIEKAFKQFIPNLTGNIKALSSAVKQIKLSESLESEEE